MWAVKRQARRAIAEDTGTRIHHRVRRDVFASQGAPMSQTRRLAAILAADVAGYSRLMGADEAGTAWALREYRAAADPLIAEHSGRIVNTTGDDALIEFGSVVGAVQCAITLQNLMTERN